MESIAGTESLVAPLGQLHFADRAVKTTSQQPQFLCLYGLMATHSADGNALVSVVNDGSRATASASNTGLGRSVSSSALCARLQLQGNCALCVLRGPHLTFQCRGDQRAQTHEVALTSSDVVALVSGVDSDEALDRLFGRVAQALELQQGDLEYAAEELLLSLSLPASGGNTAVLGKVAAFPSSPTEPPQSS